MVKDAAASVIRAAWMPCLIFCVAVTFRLWHITTYPPIEGLARGEEAQWGLGLSRMLAGAPWFYEGLPETLLLMAMAWCTHLTVWTLRVTMAVWQSTAPLATYWTVCILTRDRRAALLAGVAFACAQYAAIYARIACGDMTGAPFLAWMLCACALVSDRPARRWPWALLGLLVAACLYDHLGIRVAVLPVIAWAAWLCWRQRDAWRGAVLAAAVCALACVPLVTILRRDPSIWRYYWLDNVTRHQSVLLHPTQWAGERLALIARLAFGGTGSMSFPYATHGIDLCMGVLLVIGVGAVVWRRAVTGLLCVGLLALYVLGNVSTVSFCSFRLMLALPFVFVLVGLGASSVLGRAPRHLRWGLVVGLLVWECWWNATTLAVAMEQPGSWALFFQDHYAMAELIPRYVPPGVRVVVVGRRVTFGPHDYSWRYEQEGYTGETIAPELLPGYVAVPPVALVLTHVDIADSPSAWDQWRTAHLEPVVIAAILRGATAPCVDWSNPHAPFASAVTICVVLPGPAHGSGG